MIAEITSTDVQFGIAVTVSVVGSLIIIYILSYTLYKVMQVDEDLKRIAESMDRETEGPSATVSRIMEDSRSQHPAYKKSTNGSVPLQSVRVNVPHRNREEER